MREHRRRTIKVVVTTTKIVGACTARSFGNGDDATRLSRAPNLPYDQSLSQRAIEFVRSLANPKRQTKNSSDPLSLHGRMLAMLEAAATQPLKINQPPSIRLAVANAASTQRAVRTRRVVRRVHRVRRPSGGKSKPSNSSDGGECPPPPWYTLNTHCTSLAGTPCTSYSYSSCFTRRAGYPAGNRQPPAQTPDTSQANDSYSVISEITPCVHFVRPAHAFHSTNRRKTTLAYPRQALCHAK